MKGDIDMHKIDIRRLAIPVKSAQGCTAFRTIIDKHLVKYNYYYDIELKIIYL